MWSLLNRDEVPLYVREIAIDTAYRPHSPSYLDCVKSLLRLHNETVNIWTHLLGFLYFLSGLVLVHLSPASLGLDGELLAGRSLAPVTVQLVTYQYCMLSSACFHLFSCHSERAHFLFRALDHVGIVVALFGTMISFIDEIFSCHQWWKQTYLSLAAVLFTWVFLSHYDILTRCDRYSEFGIDTLLWLSAFVAVPYSHWAAWVKEGDGDGPSAAMKAADIGFAYAMAALGLLFYTSRYPEIRCCSGRCDILGASHQIWHVFVFVGMAWWQHAAFRHLGADIRCDDFGDAGDATGNAGGGGGGGTADGLLASAFRAATSTLTSVTSGVTSWPASWVDAAFNSALEDRMKN